MSVQGTTIAVLQQYLAAGIEVETPFGRRKLVGLEITEEEGVAACQDKEGWNDWTLLRYITPCLRPFSALCTPIDGVVPALQAFKRLPFDEEVDWSRATATLSQPAPHSMPDNWQIQLFVPVSGEEFGFSAILWNDWTVSMSPAAWERLLINALIAEHVAVGLEPGQYIPKE